MITKLALFVKKHFKNNLLGDYIINFVRIRGIDEKLYFNQVRKQYKKDAIYPTDEMIQTKKFFDNQDKRIKDIVEFLDDEQSKVTYKKVIMYRYTHDLSQAPKYTKNIYFTEELISISNDEVFVDGGAFVGDTIRKFYKISKGKYKKIIAFEPDEYNFKMLSKLNYHDVTRYKKGLWNENCKLHFTNGGGCGSKFDEKAVSSVDVCRLDDIDECYDATFIKMDIEGSELQALKGSEKIIKRNHPKLAICLYHSNEDMLSIIEYIHEIEPKYHIYVRHHSISMAETVMYAIYK